MDMNHLQACLKGIANCTLFSCKMIRWPENTIASFTEFHHFSLKSLCNLKFFSIVTLFLTFAKDSSLQLPFSKYANFIPRGCFVGIFIIFVIF